MHQRFRQFCSLIRKCDKKVGVKIRFTTILIRYGMGRRVGGLLNNKKIQKVNKLTASVMDHLNGQIGTKYFYFMPAASLAMHSIISS